MNVRKVNRIMRNESNLMKNRMPLEGNFILSLYTNPLELFDDFPIDPDKDLMTADGKYYYNLGLNMAKKGIKNFDEISIATFLEDFPELKSEYENRGGWKSIDEAISVLEPENTEAYYNALIKNNLLIKLQKKGFDIEGNMSKLNQLNTADEVIDYFDFQLNTLALNLTHDLQLQSLNLTDKDIEFKKTGQGIGLQFGKYSPLLNHFSNGIPRKGLTMFASYTNGGKTSFVFENIVIPLAEQGVKICIISNEQDAIIFKDLLYMHVLTTRLDYWNIDRRKLKTFEFTEDDEEAFKKADEIIKKEYLEYILFQRVYDYGMKNIKRTIKKLSKQCFELFVYDTFKVDATSEAVWQSFLNDSKELFQIASKENVAVITPVQLSLSTKGKIRWLNESVLSNSKQISEIYEEIFMFRDIWSDEYSTCAKDIVPTEIVYENGVSQKKPFQLVWEEGKFYKIFFHVKSRNGSNGQTVLYEFVPNTNKWKEIGYCKVDEENKI